VQGAWRLPRGWAAAARGSGAGASAPVRGAWSAVVAWRAVAAWRPPLGWQVRLVAGSAPAPWSASGVAHGGGQWRRRTGRRGRAGILPRRRDAPVREARVRRGDSACFARHVPRGARGRALRRRWTTPPASHETPEAVATRRGHARAHRCPTGRAGAACPGAACGVALVAFLTPCALGRSCSSLACPPAVERSQSHDVAARAVAGGPSAPLGL